MMNFETKGKSKEEKKTISIIQAVKKTGCFTALQLLNMILPLNFEKSLRFYISQLHSLDQARCQR